MTDPEETPAQAIERLNREIRALKNLRAKIPMLILEPYVAEASKHIREVAAAMTVKATIPAGLAIAGSRMEQQTATKPEAPPEAPPTLPGSGERVILAAERRRAIVIAALSKGSSSPEEWEVMVLTEDGRILTVRPEELAPAEAIGAAAPISEKRLSPGARVKIKPSGKTGYVSEVAGESAIVALDEGGFMTAPIADLEQI